MVNGTQMVLIGMIEDDCICENLIQSAYYPSGEYGTLMTLISMIE